VSGEVTTLAHEAGDDSVEDRVGVAETFFTGAEGSEVFAGFWGFVGVEFEDHSALGFATDGNVKVYVGHVFIFSFWLLI